MAEERTLHAHSREQGRRLDQWLSSRLADLTRSRVQRLIDEGRVLVDGSWRRRSYRINGDEEVVVYIPDLQSPDVLAEEIPLDIVHEDADLLVLDKPAGMVVHPTQHDHNGTLVNALLWHCDDLSGISGVERPGIVHRLDKETSGLLVVAKHDAAHHHLGEQFRDHTITRRYMALAWGEPFPSQGTIRSEIGRHPNDRKRMSSKAHHGKVAVTHYRILERLGPASLMEMVLETGRTHQIRVHLSEKQHPIVGDPVYGGRAGRRMPDEPALREVLEPLKRQMLHAFHLGFEHPGTREYIAWNRPPPPDFQHVLDVLREHAGVTEPWSP